MSAANSPTSGERNISSPETPQESSPKGSCTIPKQVDSPYSPVPAVRTSKTAKKNATTAKTTVPKETFPVPVVPATAAQLSAQVAKVKILKEDPTKIKNYKDLVDALTQTLESAYECITIPTKTVLADQRRKTAEILKNGIDLAKTVDASDLEETILITEEKDLSPAQKNLPEGFDKLVQDIQEIKQWMSSSKVSSFPAQDSYASAVARNQSRPARIDVTRPIIPNPRQESKGKNKAEKGKVSYALTVKSKDPSKDPRKVIQEERIFTKKIKVTPRRTYNLGSGLVKMEFDSQEDRQQVFQELEKIPTLSSRVQQKRRPMVQILGVEPHISPAELRTLILEKNPEIKDSCSSSCEGIFQEQELKFRFKSFPPYERNNRNKKEDEKIYNAVFECSTRVYRILRNLGMVSLEFKRHEVKIFYSFVQCFRCCKFGHTSNRCVQLPNPPKECCSYCMKEHARNLCLERKKENSAAPCCINCHTFNLRSKGGTRLATAHEATDRKCPSYIQAEQNFIDNVEW